ncbi:Aste57867_13258 [Aphanomyces stellatus]|uniref:Aste57867_13258 protein n=1 Tax=Aphanomyces stellatus TaxID=120398 RepID=A0A485KYC7_9STRA|nr:hypothetical protein As57867_013209 [Aphanomyces stellatus]VFT90098.1 Aste57867_13258 [Aphanomyces stellatus]
MGKGWSKAWGKVLHTIPEYPVSDEMNELFLSLGFKVHDMNHIYHLFNAINAGSFTRESLIRYAFSLYDSDASGEIDLIEAEKLVEEMWGHAWHQNKNAEHIMARLGDIARRSDGVIRIDDFVLFAHDHPLLMFPAFQIQHDMTEKILGEAFWTRIADQRERMARTDHHFKTIDDILRSFNANHAVLRQVKELVSESSLGRKYSFAESMRTKIVQLSKRHSINKMTPSSSPSSSTNQHATKPPPLAATKEDKHPTKEVHVKPHSKPHNPHDDKTTKKHHPS